MKRVTIKDVAVKTGFSKSTVSCALNGKDGVGEEARKKIIACAQELGFTPNIYAKNLSGNSYKTIGVILRDLTNPFYANVFCAIDKYCEDHNYDTLFYNLAGDANRIKKGLALMKGKMVSGIILDFFGNDNHIIDQIKQMNIPTVIFGLSIDADISCVQADDSQGAIKAVDYSIECGHKDIFYVTQRKDDVFNIRRSNAIINRLMEHGINSENRIIYVDSSNCADVIIKQCPKDSVLICYNDVLVCSVISSLMKKKLYVPDDYSVIGFDNLNIIPYELTSVNIPQYEMATQASQLLLEQIDGKKTQKITLPSNLVKRDSVKDLNANEEKQS